MDDYKYVLQKLLTAIKEVRIAYSIYPMTENSFDKIQKADARLNAAITLADELLKTN